MKSSAAEPLYLAIDQGGHATRAQVYDASGTLLVEERRELGVVPRADGRMEYDAAAMLESMHGVIGAAVAGLGRARRRLRCAGLATQRSNVACWDRVSGAALAPLISWQDRRAPEHLDALRGHADEVRRITGLVPSAHYGASKLRWCLEHLRAVAEALDSGHLAWGPMASFLAFHLLEERPLCADPVNAARTLLFDLDRGDWSDRMLALFALPRDPLPAAVANRYDFGTLNHGRLRLPFTVLTGDQNAALHAAGPPREDTLYVTLGTGAFVLRTTGAARVPSSRLLNGVLHDDGARRLHALEGTVNGAGSALDWLEAHTGRGGIVTGLHHWLERCDEPPLFLNAVSGLGTPYMIPDFAPRFIGDGGPAARAVAVVESIVFLLQVNIEEMDRLHPAAARIHAGGGLSRYDGLCGRLANLSGLPVWRARTPETTGLGLGRLLAAADGSAADGAPEEAEGEWFMPRYDERLHARYRRWREELEQAIRD